MTKSDSLSGEGAGTRYWALRFEHPCDDFHLRQWRTDIGLTRIDPDNIRFVLTTTHRVIPGYIGEEPAAPAISAPKLVRTILGGPHWQAHSGQVVLSERPSLLEPGHGDFLRDQLYDPNRVVPLILVTLGSRDQRYALNPVKLANMLAGAAQLFAATSPDVDIELEHLLPRSLRCWDGRVRVYQPRISEEDDGKRHRFFLPSEIEEIGEPEIQKMIVRGVVRRGRLWIGPAVATLEDVDSRQREARLARLRAENEDRSSKEWVSLLEAENAELSGKIKALEERIDELDTEKAAFEITKAEMDRKYNSLQGEVRRLTSHLDREKQESADARRALETVEQLARLPESLSDVVRIVSALHPERIAFTERAIKSADEAKFDDVAGAWRCLWGMATVLHRLHFEGNLDAKAIAHGFLEEIGFELAMTEGKQTKADKKMVSARKDLWQNEEIDISPHVKCDKGTRFLRVHYCAHKPSKLIVIGHCGDHLETSGTRRM